MVGFVNCLSWVCWVRLLFTDCVVELVVFGVAFASGLSRGRLVFVSFCCLG